ncbi:hypothetical protein FRB90_011792 [Tulasnella sp. 427]|nr:hypothetical protein FRB90_011792 [Tulasnella sp. 427]
MAEGSKNTDPNPTTMPPIKSEDLEARYPLYIQRLRQLLGPPYPTHDKNAASYYELCLLCDAAALVKDLRLSEFLSSEQLRVLTEIRQKTEGFNYKPGFKNNPYENIPSYVKGSILPPMGWVSSLESLSKRDVSNTGSSSRTKTSSSAVGSGGGGTTKREPDHVRRLGKINRFNMDEFQKKVNKYVDDLPKGFQKRESRQGGMVDATEDLDEDYVLSIPSFSFSTEAGLRKFGTPRNEIAVQQWVHGLIGRTSQTLVHLCNPSTLSFDFGSVDGPGTARQKCDLCWQRSAASSDQPWIRRLVVEVKTPWTLDPVTFEKFVAAGHIPSKTELEQKKERFSKVHRIWAQIYDYCVIQGTFFFVLTSYEYWVFGVFPTDYTFAWVTDLIPNDSKEPTILGCMMYWILSAMLAQGLQPVPWGSDQPELGARTSITTLKDVAVQNIRAARAIINAI